MTTPKHLKKMKAEELKRYFQWLSAWVVDGERMEGRVHLPTAKQPR